MELKRKFNGMRRMRAPLSPLHARSIIDVHNVQPCVQVNDNHHSGIDDDDQPQRRHLRPPPPQHLKVTTTVTLVLTIAKLTNPCRPPVKDDDEPAQYPQSTVLMITRDPAAVAALA